MRRITWVLAIVMSVAILVAGCGKKDATAVVQDLDKVMSKLESYAGIGTMTLHSGQQPLEYRVEVWYQNPSYYRIELKNEKKDITQIVLRNKEGVFVLTPSLNKIFRFQSDWPENQGQVYLYQTLVRSILSDNARQFTADGEDYVFEVAANYQTDSLVRQKIWLNKDSYAPKQVQVSDSDSKVIVEMKFNQFDFGKKFEQDSFDMQRNMTSMKNAALPNTTVEVDKLPTGETKETNAQVDNSEHPDSTEPSSGTTEGTGSETTGSDAGANDRSNDEAELGPFGIIEPSYLPEGVAKKDEPAIPDSKEHAVVIRYTGTYNFTLMESRPKDMETGLPVGEGLNLGFTVGQLSGEEQKALTWMYDGVKYRIVSADLPTAEMVKIAQSLVDQPGK
ncbi:membrane protein [Paenibacillus sp. E194]|uniref:LolA family protein n=1 Tax=Paenibacillus sp. E194 TaxID=1458845 RepID=UPI0005C98FF1|nr:outer membrane lipoprotein carrier protein LolA [Paenibacillus sp. E194]KJB89319.1 membrane protein [Paenibacillus sp. E194]